MQALKGIVQREEIGLARYEVRLPENAKWNIFVEIFAIRSRSSALLGGGFSPHRDVG